MCPALLAPEKPAPTGTSPGYATRGREAWSRPLPSRWSPEYSEVLLDCSSHAGSEQNATPQLTESQQAPSAGRISNLTPQGLSCPRSELTHVCSHPQATFLRRRDPNAIINKTQPASLLAVAAAFRRASSPLCS